MQTLIKKYLTLSEILALPDGDITYELIEGKAVDYLSAGVNRVWIIDSKAKKITIFYPDSPSQTKSNNQSLADDIFPNLTLTSQQISGKNK